VAISLVSDRTASALRVFFALAFLFAVSSWTTAQSAFAPNLTAERLAAMKQAVVIVTTFDQQDRPLLQGSGFFISANCIVTNSHVIRNATRIEIKTFSGRTSTTHHVLADNESDDLALLVLEGSLTNEVLQLEESTPLEGEPIIVLSNPKGCAWKFTYGQIGLLWEFGGFSGRIQISAPISPGSSGAPVVNERGRVVGVAAMHIPGDEELNFAVPAESLRALLNSSTNSALGPVLPAGESK